MIQSDPNIQQTINRLPFLSSLSLFFFPSIKLEAHDVTERYSIRWNQASKRRTNEFLSRNLLLCSRRGFSRFCRLELASRPHYGIVMLLLLRLPLSLSLSVSRCFEIREIWYRIGKAIRWKQADPCNYDTTLPPLHLLVSRLSIFKWKIIDIPSHRYLPVSNSISAKFSNERW